MLKTIDVIVREAHNIKIERSSSYLRWERLLQKVAEEKLIAICVLETIWKNEQKLGKKELGWLQKTSTLALKLKVVALIREQKAKKLIKPVKIK